MAEPEPSPYDPFFPDEGTQDYLSWFDNDLSNLLELPFFRALLGGAGEFTPDAFEPVRTVIPTPTIDSLRQFTMSDPNTIEGFIGNALVIEGQPKTKIAAALRAALASDEPEDAELRQMLEVTLPPVYGPDGTPTDQPDVSFIDSIVDDYYVPYREEVSAIREANAVEDPQTGQFYAETPSELAQQFTDAGYPLPTEEYSLDMLGPTLGDYTAMRDQFLSPGEQGVYGAEAALSNVNNKLGAGPTQAELDALMREMKGGFLSGEENIPGNGTIGPWAPPPDAGVAPGTPSRQMSPLLGANAADLTPEALEQLTGRGGPSDGATWGDLKTYPDGKPWKGDASRGGPTVGGVKPISDEMLAEMGISRDELSAAPWWQGMFPSDRQDRAQRGKEGVPETPPPWAEEWTSRQSEKIAPAERNVENAKSQYKQVRDQFLEGQDQMRLSMDDDFFYNVGRILASQRSGRTPFSDVAGGALEMYGVPSPQRRSGAGAPITEEEAGAIYRQLVGWDQPQRQNRFTRPEVPMTRSQQATYDENKKNHPFVFLNK